LDASRWHRWSFRHGAPQKSLTKGYLIEAIYRAPAGKDLLGLIIWTKAVALENRILPTGAIVASPARSRLSPLVHPAFAFLDRATPGGIKIGPGAVSTPLCRVARGRWPRTTVLNRPEKAVDDAHDGP
jgi:hypothetical protein